MKLPLALLLAAVVAAGAAGKAQRQQQEWTERPAAGLDGTENCIRDDNVHLRQCLLTNDLLAINWRKTIRVCERAVDLLEKLLGRDRVVI